MIALSMSFWVVMICGLGVAWPFKKGGCLGDLVHPLAGVVGAILPLVIWWWSESPALEILLIGALVGAFILNVGAVALAATCWQAVLLRKPDAAEEKMVDSLVNPFSFMENSSLSGSNFDFDDLIGGCLLMLIIVIFNVFFVSGLLIARVFHWLLPSSRTDFSRAARVVLSLIYTVIVYAAGASVLSLLVG
ncbi:MAG: hypothetical protein HY866_00165 [Chloroflexi bacterium]|nr:hypothetical protein [Chloroflexota bacterium]